MANNNKFGRNYVLNVVPNNSPTPITFSLPLTIEFDVIRNTLTSINSATITLYNLSKDHRNVILKDWYDRASIRTIILQAGYALSKALPTIFIGTVYECSSRREGVNFLTEITSNSGGAQIPSAFYRGSPFKPGTTDRTIITTLIDLLSHEERLSVGFIDQFPTVHTSSYSPNLPIWEELQVLTGNGLWIDNNKIYAVNNQGVVPSKTPITIDSSTGLLDTPKLESSNMIVPIIFTPEITPGTIVNIQSTTVPTVLSSGGSSGFNGPHKVVSVRHRGIISDAVCGDLRTELGMQWGYAVTS